MWFGRSLDGYQRIVRRASFGSDVSRWVLDIGIIVMPNPKNVTTRLQSDSITSFIFLFFYCLKIFWLVLSGIFSQIYYSVLNQTICCSWSAVDLLIFWERLFSRKVKNCTQKLAINLIVMFGYMRALFLKLIYGGCPSRKRSLRSS